MTRRRAREGGNGSTREREGEARGGVMTSQDSMIDMR